MIIFLFSCTNPEKNNEPSIFDVEQFFMDIGNQTDDQIRFDSLEQSVSLIPDENLKSELIDFLEVYEQWAFGLEKYWLPGDQETAGEGGVSEVAFEFEKNGDLWAIGRNEDGDNSGAGTQICHADAKSLSEWNCLENSDPERYDSPEMFRHGENIYLLGRKDIGGTFGPDGDLLAYSFRPKGFALYKINKEIPAIEWIMDLPGIGDTSFPSVHRLSTHEFLFANYTSPLDNEGISWFEGQTSIEGTQIYTMKLIFEPQD